MTENVGYDQRILTELIFKVRVNVLLLVIVVYLVYNGTILRSLFFG